MERTETSETRVLPLAEKVERVNLVKAKLPGLLITQQLEPSHQLIDKAVQQWEENSLKYIDLTSCTSREQEVLAEKINSKPHLRQLRKYQSNEKARVKPVLTHRRPSSPNSHAKAGTGIRDGWGGIVFGAGKVDQLAF